MVLEENHSEKEEVKVKKVQERKVPKDSSPILGQKIVLVL